MGQVSAKSGSAKAGSTLLSGLGFHFPAKSSTKPAKQLCIGLRAAERVGVAQVSFIPRKHTLTQAKGAPLLGAGSNQPKATREEVLSTEVVHANVAKPAGVLLLFHGCQHSAIDWWPAQPSCPSCIGLPEEVRITKAAAAHNLVAVALSSRDRLAHRCWDATWPVEQCTEIQQVGKVIKQLLERESWNQLPLYALGVSSGGAMALLLASHMPLQ
ncbi:hypothetical protein WJX74_010780 [Apatococcus lobatus]